MHIPLFFVSQRYIILGHAAFYSASMAISHLSDPRWVYIIHFMVVVSFLSDYRGNKKT